MDKSILKTGDKVLVIAGKDRGKTGKVMHVLPQAKKAVVEGANVYKKNVKPSKKYPQGGIIDINSPLQISNLLLICPSCQKATRVAAMFEGKDKRRICKKCKEVVQ